MSAPTPPPPPVDPGKVLRFRDGILGFPHCQRFVLQDLAEDGAFQLLQSLDEPDMAMVVGVPWTFFPDYSPELDEAEQRALGIEAPDDAVVFCPVTLDSGDDTVYLNLLGPFVVNARTREGRQVVLADASHPLRAPVHLADRPGEG